LQRKRLIFDISTLARSGGAKGGILRVVSELATWARSGRDDVVFAVYESESEAFRTVHDDCSEMLWQGRADIDFSRRRKSHGSQVPLRDRLPDPLRELALWLHAPRRRTMVAFERWRLSVKSISVRAFIERLQSPLLSAKLRRELWDTEGQRRAVIPLDMALGPAVDLNENDVLIVAGAEWLYTRPTMYGDLKEKYGNKLAFLCHDIIPLLFPQIYKKRTVNIFREYIHEILPIADLVIFNSRRSELDAREYCVANNVQIAKTRVMRFGTKIIPQNIGLVRPLPYGLEAEHYMLFVSNFDARKGHALLFSVWKRLLTQGVPQAHRFKLVFFGHRGSDNMLLDEIDGHPNAGDTLLILSSVGDDTLATLYQQAAFCLFPSLYEGYGLPAIEGFGYGKAILASTGGALPEVIGDLSPCLDPLDEQAWFEAIKLWIEQPMARARFEIAIRDRFRPTTWQEAAEGFFRLLDTEL
jgi:glycosyltransferase involved in cell wall biosynthesis